MMLLRHTIDTQVDRMLTVVAAGGGVDALDRLRAAAYDDLRTWADLDVVERPASDTARTIAEGSCDVAGAYLSVAGRPTILVSVATVARMNFTALHELGHHLQRTDDDLFVRLLESPHTVELEEAACDHFAARVLLPEQLVEEHLGGGVTAQSVAALWRASSASRSAVCIAASRRLLAPGHVLLLEPDGHTVIDANRELPRVRRASDQSRHPVIARALQTGGRTTEGSGSLTYRDSIRGADLFTQAGDIDGYLVVVAVLDSAPWRRLSIPSADPGPQARWRDCEHCGETFRSFARPCPRCGVVACVECARCNCTVQERTCDRCFLVLPVSAFAGDSTACLDCS
jgi:hypothetical protein